VNAKSKKRSVRPSKPRVENRTTRSQAEEAQARLAAIVESSEDAIIGKSLDGTITNWNQGAERLFGYTAEEIVGQPVALLIPADRFGEEPGILARLQRGERVDHFETVRVRKNGEPVSVSLTISPIRNQRGQIIGASKIARDISARQRAEKELEESRARFEGIINSAMDAIITVDINQKILLFNGAAERMFRCRAGDVLGLALDRFIPEHLRNAHRKHIHAFDRTGVTNRSMGKMNTITGVRSDGEVFPIEASISQAMVAGQKLFTVILRDISERKRAEENLQERDERFRQIAENINEVFWITNLAMDQMIYVSPAYEKIWGRTCDSLYEHPHNWIDAIHPDDRDRVIKSALNQTQRVNYDETYRILRPNGTVRWIHDRGFPICNAEGVVYRIVGTAEDITKQRKLEEQFLQAQKMEAIGTLAGGIAHDFNNILAAITGYAELGKMAAKDLPKVREYLDTILQAGNRAIGLVKQILTFSRQQEQTRETVQLREVVDESVKLLRATIPATIEFNISLAADASPVLADVNQIHQVVMNLGTNAWHAMKDKPGRLNIKLENFTVDAAMSETHNQLRPRPYVRLSVSDTGCGMPQAVMKHIFEPFYTTKPRGEGTGLGLSVVHGIMQSHDGTITVYSQIGEGTVFHLYFPVHESEVRVASAPDAPAPHGDGKRILFVDDEEVLATLGAKNLTHLGYKVETKTSPAEALEAFRANPSQYDLVITDQNMTGMTGVDFAKLLLEIRPNIPIILTTGYSPKLSLKIVQAMGIRDLLPKPHTIQLLARTVQRALAGKSS
jgi:PAS domain S-box-containing protein